MRNNINKYSEGKNVGEIISKAQISKTSFYDIKSKKQVPRLDTAIKISKALEIPIYKIFPELEEVLK